MASLCLALFTTSCAKESAERTAAPSPSTPVTTSVDYEHPPTVFLPADDPVAAGPPGPRGNVVSTTRPTDNGSGVVATTTTAVTSTTLPSGLPAEKCPDAKSCRRGALLTDKPLPWPTGANGRATVRYRVNTNGSTSKLTPSQMADAIAASFRTWQTAAPILEFVFEGFSSDPLVEGDGQNTISFAPGWAHAPIRGTSDGHMAEADMYLGSADYVWNRCEQRDGSCTPVDDGGRIDLQALVTHEAGHWLGLADMNDDVVDRELTMSPRASAANSPPPDRRQVTLALGDVLWIRKTYPCSCPLPSIYSP